MRVLEKNTFEGCIRELAIISKEKPARGMSNAKGQIKKLSRRSRRLLDLLHFHREAQQIDVRLVEHHIRDTFKRMQLLREQVKSHA
jgi:hypothetical protein